MKDVIKKQQQEIERKYRPVPFWSWNDRLDPELLRWQIREMDKAGLGGFFMHARGGLQTEYLGDEWMDCVGACLDEAQKTGMEAWLYDEEGWPSGFGGGEVTDLGDRYHGRWLVVSRFDSEEVLKDAGLENLLHTYEYGGEILAVSHTSNPYYVDVMSRDAVAAFIESTHERYYRRFKEHFDGTVKGFFTDEPRLSGDVEGDVPWSYCIREVFRERHGYDIVPRLHALFVKCEGYEKVRYDFYRTVNDLFVSAYMEQIQAWCHAHHCKLTGHMMMEESIFTQMTGTGGVMPFYEYMDVPGIDWLRRMIGSPVVPRQLSSVAHQTGKKQTLTESFALTGWNVRMEELKWIIDWQIVNGVNLLCPHLAGYTLRGLRKRDYPLSLFYQLPWWEKYCILNDYVSRIGKMLSEGEYRAEVLLIHPMRSGWVAYEGAQNEALIRLDHDFTSSVELLSGMQIEYDLGDESILARHGKIEAGGLRVGHALYGVVALPSMITIDTNTLDLLHEFAQAGGTILSLGRFPHLVNGIQGDPGLDTLQKKTVSFDMADQRDAIRGAFTHKGVRSCTLTDQDTGGDITEIHSRRFFDGGTEWRFFVNHRQDTTYRADIGVKGKGVLYEMDLLTGAVSQAPDQQETAGYIQTKAVFAPMQSRLFALIHEEDMSTAGMKKEDSTSKDEYIVIPSPQWDIEEMTDNAITLDTCSYRIDGGEWRPPKAVIHIFDELLALKRPCRISMKFAVTANCDMKVLQDAFLVLERAGEFDIEINGTTVQYRDSGYWLDSSFLRVEAGAYLVEGANEIILTREFYQSENVYHVLFDDDVYETEINKLTYDVELESLYLAGRFGVRSVSGYTSGEREAYFTKGPFEVVEPPETTGGNMTIESMPFFTGRVSLGQDIEIDAGEGQRVVLRLKRPSAAISEVWVNGALVRSLPWAPYDVDITDTVHRGKNHVTVKLFSGNRNLLGPHHHIDGELYNVGPESFTGRWSWVEKSTEAKPATREERERGYWNEDYCFVRFGL